MKVDVQMPDGKVLAYDTGKHRYRLDDKVLVPSNWLSEVKFGAGPVEGVIVRTRSDYQGRVSTIIRKLPKNPDKPSPLLGKRFPAEHMPRTEIHQILQYLDTPRWTNQRNRTLIIVLWRCGLRIAEALDLKPQNIDLEALQLRVLDGKNHKDRTVGLDQQTAELLRPWLVSMQQRGGLVFQTSKGGPLTTSYIRAMLPRVAKAAGVTRTVHAHIFRHTFAVELAKEGVSMPMIQQLLGHDSLATTSTYLSSLSPEDALNAVRGRVW